LRDFEVVFVHAANFTRLDDFTPVPVTTEKDWHSYVSRFCAHRSHHPFRRLRLGMRDFENALADDFIGQRRFSERLVLAAQAPVFVFQHAHCDNGAVPRLNSIGEACAARCQHACIHVLRCARGAAR
jgi:hypothetical protein